MAQSLSKILLHIVFSTKNRADIIPESVLKDLHSYIAGICRNNNSEAFRVGGTENHIHISCSLPRTMTVSELLEEIKKTSSKWMKSQENVSNNFSWQSGYGVFSLRQSNLDVLIKYIDNQKEHHKKKSYKEEFIDFLEKYKIEYNEKYLWD